jgi:ribosomal protein S18 acetylase RimI-like enzyme
MTDRRRVAARPDRSVRPAVAEDADAVARIQVRGIRAAIQAGLGPQGEAPALSTGAVRERWRTTLEAAAPSGCHTLVALHGSAVAGFLSCAPGPALGPVPGDQGDVPAGTDILALEVLPDFARSGHASRLLSALVDIARPHVLRVWVTAGDDAHTRFYQGAGFAPAGLRRRLAVGGRAVTEHLWWSRLSG